MAYVIATTRRKVQWYRFKSVGENGVVRVIAEVLDILDLTQVTTFPSRNEAKACFKASGLPTCRYFKF